MEKDGRLPQWRRGGGLIAFGKGIRESMQAAKDVHDEVHMGASRNGRYSVTGALYERSKGRWGVIERPPHINQKPRNCAHNVGKSLRILATQTAAGR
jgi:hypothetical protein